MAPEKVSSAETPPPEPSHYVNIKGVNNFCGVELLNDFTHNLSLYELDSIC